MANSRCLRWNCYPSLAMLPARVAVREEAFCSALLICHLLLGSLQWLPLSVIWNADCFPDIVGPVAPVRLVQLMLPTQAFHCNLCRFLVQCFPHSGMFCLLSSIYLSCKYLYYSSSFTPIAVWLSPPFLEDCSNCRHMSEKLTGKEEPLPPPPTHSLFYFTPYCLSPCITYSCIVHLPPWGTGTFVSVVGCFILSDQKSAWPMTSTQ